MTSPLLTPPTFGTPSASPWLGSPSGVIGVAAEQISSAGSFLALLGSAANGVIAPSVTPEFPSGNDAPALEVTTVPELQQIELEFPAVPGLFTEDIEIVEAPTFTGEAPGLNLGTAPTFEMGLIPDAPGVSVPGVPGPPSVVLPPVPNLLQLDIQAFGGMTLPVAPDEELPTVTLVEPSIANYVPGEQYTSGLLEALKTELQRRITEGGTGLSADVEQGIFDRARERELKAVQDALDGLERMETMGFAFPPGVYLDGRVKIETEFGKVAAGLSRDIMIKQAELELANVQEALKTATQLEAQLLDYTSKVEQRVFEAARYTTEAGVQIYNAKVEAYKALLDAYRTKITIYEAKIRAELAKVEAYKAQIAAEQAKADINTALVNQYRIKADVALSAVEIYKAQIAGVQAAAGVEQVRVQIYAEQVRAFSAKANAFTATVEGYRAQTQAEVAKQDAYRSQVEAFKAQVDAAAKVTDARIAVHRGRIDAYLAEWKGFESASQAEASRAQAITASNQSLVEAYRAEVTGTVGFNEVLTKQWQVALEQAQRVAEIGVSAAKANGDLYIAAKSIAMDAAKVGAQVAAQLGAAALNALNWSNSFSLSNASSQSFANSNSTSTNTNYNL
jgi:hypothetical protein